MSIVKIEGEKKDHKVFLYTPLGFPLIMIDDDKVISGYKEEEIKEALGL
jgi:hypothetical protein